jgi:surface antigen
MIALRPVFAAVFLGLAGLLLTGTAEAQVNPFKSAKNAPKLDDQDLTLLDEAAHRILDAATPAKGAVETWRNTASGASGKIYYVGPTRQTVRRTEYDCRRLQYDIVVKGRERPHTTSVDWCHDVDGSWKLL